MRRGQCPVCRYRFRLRKDGTLQTHRLYSGHDRCEEPCAGSGQPPKPLGWDEHGRPDCGECLMYLYGPDSAGLGEAISSVAIESGGDPQRMLRDYFTAYHARDHKLDAEPGAQP